MDEKGRRGYRSLFWPTVLIGVGVTALLGNLGVLSRENFVVLLRLWPLLLVLIGLDVMFGRRAPALGALIGIAAIVLLVFLMLVGPSLGWDQGAETKTDFFSAPIGEASAARMELDLSSGPTQINALSDSGNLIEADLTYIGRIEFDVQGEREKTVRLAQYDSGEWFFFDWFGDDEQRWDIGLSPTVPLELQVDVGSGSATLNLGALQLRRLDIDGGSGTVEGELPGAEEQYQVQLDGSSGNMTLRLPKGSDVDMEIGMSSGIVKIEIDERADVNLRVQDGSSGKLIIDAPDDAAVRLDVRDDGSGRIRVPSRFERTRRGDDDQGTWETPGFGTADYRIEISVDDMSSGDIEIY